jgi:hypothetical protein
LIIVGGDDLQNTLGNENGILYRYIMFGRGIWEKYQSRDEKFPKPNGEGNLVLIPLPNMIYLFNYTEYYLEHWIVKCEGVEGIKNYIM